MNLKQLFEEFKAFAFKGNMIDLAVAVIIGAAFAKVMDALVKAVIMPALSYVLPGEGSYAAWTLGRVQVGIFVAELLNFLIVAAAVFVVIIKMLGWIRKLGEAPVDPAAPAAPAVKQCPHCVSEVPLAASRCRFCTSELTAG
ncbi:MAG: large conductance mechanosensitive channel protein MscL [Phycisphaerae bacterium]